MDTEYFATRLAELLADRLRRRITIYGFDVPAANVPHIYAADIGYILAKNEPFAVTYCDGPSYREFVLYADKYGEDVSDIAKQYGGGGVPTQVVFPEGLQLAKFKIHLAEAYDMFLSDLRVRAGTIKD